MRMVRHVVLVSFFLLVALFLSGCQNALVCEEPNRVIGTSCCLDDDSDGVCDTLDINEPDLVADDSYVEEMESEQDPSASFADVFASTWNRKSYNALYSLFVKDYRLRFSSQEFNFLARKLDESLGIKSISLVGVSDGVAKYGVALADKNIVVSSAVQQEEDGLKQESFYFFDDLTPENACGTDSSCFMSFAVISGDKNYCAKAGDLKTDCDEKFGLSRTLSKKIDECVNIVEYYGKVECLNRLAVNENDIEPCWQASYDKQIFECMGFVAAAREDVDECDDFVSSKGYPGTRLQKAYCIAGYVKETSDTSACAKIDRRGDVVLGSMQEACYKLQLP